MIDSPASCAMMSIAEQRHEVESDSDGRDKISPPRTPPLIGDRVVHHAGVFVLLIETVFMNKQGKGTLHHFIHESLRWLDRLPATDPMHWNDTPIATVNFNQTALSRRHFRFQFGHSHRRWHDVSEVVRIAVKGEHRRSASS